MNDPGDANRDAAFAASTAYGNAFGSTAYGNAFGSTAADSNDEAGSTGAGNETITATNYDPSNGASGNAGLETADGRKAA